MRFTTRMALLAAALALPLCVALASYALASDPPAPHVPTGVRIGEDAGTRTGEPLPGTTTTQPTDLPTTNPPPAPQVVPHAPPVTDDDQGDDSDDGGDDDDDGD